MVFHSFFVSILYRMGRFGYFAICKVVEKVEYRKRQENTRKINKAFIGEIVLTNYSVIWQKVQ